MFPYASDGWHLTLKKFKKDGTPGKQLSPLKYYRYRLQIRDGFNLILRCGRLFQEYLCGQFYKIEKLRLNWVRNNQKKLRAESYSGLHDAISNDEDLSKQGINVILPPSHHGKYLSLG